ncbi:immunoglobulin superfamily member 3-like protein [Labeo rohita]|nr:immunoglobulin superfamily member 3-like protein [Labeo rohita]
MEASYSGSSSQSLSEGDPLQLECQVSSKTFQHTHLSVTWFLHGEEDKTPRPIITLDKDLTVKTGAGFEDHYRAGLISMDKVEETTYRLKMPQVQQSDQGKFYCKAIEWIQDPDCSWTQIAHKTTTACNVEIKRIEVAPDAGSFSVHVTASKRTLQEGNPLDIRCSVNAQNLPGYFFSVTWLKNQQKVAQIGSSGVLTIFDSYKERENAAEMRAVKTSHTDYLLTIRSARTEDQGQYQCEVWQENMNEDGTFKKIQKQMSSPETVSITAKESDLAVVMEMKDVVTEGDSLRVTCSVSGFKGPLSVSWQHKKGVSFSDVISLTHEGVMKDIGASKMRLYSPTSHLETTVNTDAKIDCSVTTTTTNTSRFMVTWMIGSQMLLTMDLDAVVKFGSAASLEKDQRIRMEIKQKQTFQLTIHQVRTSDSGQYHCEVEEWLQDPLGDWYSLEKRSVSTDLAVIEKAIDFKMNKANHTLKIEEGKQLMLNCLVDGIKSDSTLRYSLTWLFSRDQSSSVTLLTYSHDGRLTYNSFDSELEGRLHFSTPEVGVFHLTIHRSIQEDSGRYYCQVEQHQLDCEGQWSRKASDESGFTDVTVKLIQDNLHVDKENRTLNITNLQTGFTIDCVIKSRSSDASMFEVTWSKGQRNEQPVIIFSASHDGILHSAISDKDLVFGHPSAMHYMLTVPNVNPTDTGLYHCQVAEWIQTAENKWRKIGDKKSGELSVHVNTEEKQKEDSFAMDRTDKHLDIKEGERFELECSLDVGKEDPTHQYSLRWVFNSPESVSGIPLLTYSHNGRLQYLAEKQQLKDRLRFSRPTSESNLRVQKENRMSNITNHQTGFTVDCVIDSQSSQKSVFEVTWFRAQEKMPVTMFIARRDGTLYNAVGDKNLLFGRPRATHYKLTVPQISSTDMGQYYCQVDEWLLTANTWKKLDSDTSGKLSIFVHTEAGDFRMNKSNTTLMVKEGEQLMLNCSVDGIESDSTLRYTLTWLRENPLEGQSSRVTLLKYSYDGSLSYNSKPEGRLHFSTPKVGVFHLTIRRSIQEDSGRYYCEAEQHQLDCKGTWSYKAKDTSGFTDVELIGESEKQTSSNKDPLGMALGVTIPLICILVLVIILLLRREQKRNSELKKKKDCLWAENNPLTLIAEVTPAAGDHS